MGSLYLNSLSAEQRKELEGNLHQAQDGNCFICEKPIDFQLHAKAIDIDHVEPLKVGGKDDPSNFALTHSSCNRSKQASDLRVARVLARFAAIRDEAAKENRGPNLSDVLRHYNGAAHELHLIVGQDCVSYSFPEIGRNEIHKVPLYRDDLSGLLYFFAKLPIEYLFHDDRINPRAVGGSLNGLIEEFHKKRPQLQVSLGWTVIEGNHGSAKVKVFDGQHKATAQVLLGVRDVPLRIFLNPNVDVLLSANTNAGTTLRQIAFDKSVQRHLGSALFWEPHLIAYRLSREEILYSWLRFVRQIIQNYFIMTGKPIQEQKLCQYRFPEPLWDNIDNFLGNLIKMPLWVNRDLSLSVFGGKQNYEYWQTIFESGKTPQGQHVLSNGINLMKMIQL